MRVLGLLLKFPLLLNPGEFGIVYKAHLIGTRRGISSGQLPTAVAVKTLKGILYHSLAIASA